MSNDIHSLKRMNKVYEYLLDKIDVGIQVVDAEGNTIIYNRKKMLLESMNREDVLYRNLLDVFRFESEQDSRLMQALKMGKATENESQTYFTYKGKRITTLNNTFPLIENEKIIGAVEIAHDITKIEQLRENVLLKGNTRYTLDSIIGRSELLKEVITQTKRAAKTSSSVLIVGETGTGKELFAQSIHHASVRSNKPFISQNCAALPNTLIESILFGTKKGAFTGATEHPGLFEQAEGGTLLLDEINSLDPSLQAKLLRVIQERTIRRIGDTKDKKIDVRIIATMNEDPFEAIAENRLRKDLYYRLSVVSLFIPSLKERKEDIDCLCEYFIKKYNEVFQTNVKKVSTEVMKLFYEYNWPGNVRELEHIIEGAMNLIDDDHSVIETRYLPHLFLRKSNFQITGINQPIKSVTTEVASPTEHFEIKELKDYMEEAEVQYITKVLEKCNNNISRAAMLLGVSRQSLQYRLRKYQNLK